MSDDDVRAQYDAYPYPNRDPADETGPALIGSPGNLLEVNHHAFGGRLDVGRPLKVLVAGGGTGDGTIALAQQLADAGSPAGITYVDVSRAAREIAEARAATRGLANITFHTLSLLDVADQGWEPFDYIDCCGVLHHLDDPQAGLNALAAVLSPAGGIGAMVYGELGRTGVYDLQAALKTLKPRGTPADRVRYARHLLAHLPPGNRFRTNPVAGDHQRGDAELHDLLLNARDRAYRVPDLFELTGSAGLAITGLIKPVEYDPSIYFDDDETLGRIDELDGPARAALAELLGGSQKTHVFYAVPRARAETAVARPAADMVPVLYQVGARALAETVAAGKSITVNVAGAAIQRTLPPGCGEMIRLMDGTRTLGAIHERLSESDPDLDWETFIAMITVVHEVLNGAGALFLRHESVRF